MNFLEGRKLIKQKEYGKALDVFFNLQKNGIKNKTIYFYLGLIYSELNDFNKSIFYYNKYLTLEPNSISALHNLAIINQSIGELDTAKEIYLKLIKQDKSNIRAYFGLLMLNINNLTIEHYLQINQIKKSNKFSLYEKSLVNFILSKKEKENKNYKKEIEYLEEFNSDSYNSNYAYNQSSQFYYNEIINNFYNKINFIGNDIDLKKTKNFIPIFIIGLPRSGSTLIESILTSSDEKITTCGESHVINMSLLEQVGHKIYIENFDIKKFIFEIDNINFQKSILKRYNQFNSYNEKESSSVIDKSLENFYNIEAILNIFPNAKFLHTYRNAIDATISIYQAMLSELSWTHKIEDILNYINNYKKIMKHFYLKYPEKIMDINLENFTQDSERVSEKIFEFCQLKWNKKALEFYKRNNLFSKTASFNQIRKKVLVYDTKKYEPYVHLLQNYKNKYNWLKIN